MFDPGETAFKRGLRLGIGLVAVAAVVFVLWKAWTVVEALVIATVLATALWPWASRLSAAVPRKRLPRPAAVTAIFVATFATLAGMLTIAVSGLLPLLDRAATEYPGVAGPIRTMLEPFRTGDVGEGARRVVEGAADGTAAGVGNIDAATVVIAIPGGAITLGLVLIFTFFLLLDGDRYAGWAFMLMPRDRRPAARALSLRIRDRLSRWVIGWASYGVVAGVVVGLAMVALGIPSPWLYGILALVFALLPAIGSVLAFVPAAFVALEGPAWQLPAVIATAAAYHLVDAMLVAPRMVGGSLRLPTFVSLIAVLVGAALFGFWGALIASPVTAAIHQTLTEHLRPHADAA